ncbi:AbrB/MazE/SpoVT family DNA-binding domain-containing protein [Acidobacteria bacterium AB60]|nr:AbrB/MazE/SpoVT family DNA-binding domain-containing protein [Acidobacteria bacterium AB60]
MRRATVTTKGQITIPVEVREAMRLQPGSKLVFLDAGDGSFVVRRMGSIRELEGIFAGYAAPGANEGLDELIGKHVVELDERTKSGAQPASDEAA